MKYYADLDVSLQFVSICVIDGEGKIAFERSASCEAEIIAST